MIARVNGSTTQYYHFDELGNTVFLTDSSAVVTDKSPTTPGAMLLRIRVAHPSRINTSEDLVITPIITIQTCHTYIQTGVRLYNPEVGRYMQEDPIREREHYYEYVSKNPLTGKDPTGLHNHKNMSVWIIVHGDCCRESSHFKNMLSVSVKYRVEDQEGLGSEWRNINPCANGKIGPIDDIAWQDPVTHKINALHLPN